MTRNRFVAPIRLLAGLLLVLVAISTGRAGNPILVNSETGLVTWRDGVTFFNTDRGPLGILDNETAVQMVRDGFATWASVPTATLTAVDQGPIRIKNRRVDVDIDNFGEILFQLDGQSPVIFDHDGSIMDALGVGFFAGVSIGEFLTPGLDHYLERAIILDGRDIDADGPFTPVGWQGLVNHEIGHHVGIGHSVVNGQAFFFGDPLPGLPPPPASSLETMYPFLLLDADFQAFPHKNDVSILSLLYPAPGFLETTGAIRGEILSADLVTGLGGVNVTARNLSDPFADAVSNISGAFDFFFDIFPRPPATGFYSIDGLTAGASYSVAISDITRGGFSSPILSPLPGPEEFYNGANEGNDPDRDFPEELVPVLTQAGLPVEGIDIAINSAASARILNDPNALEPPDDAAVSGFAVPPEIDIRRVEARFDDTDGDGGQERFFVGVDVVGPLGARRSAFRFELDFGEVQRVKGNFLSLKDQTLEPGTGGVSTSDVTLELAFTARGPEFSGLPSLAANSRFIPETGRIEFVASVEEILAAATPEQLDAANNFDGTFTLLGFSGSDVGRSADRVPDTNDNDDPSIVQETSRFTFAPFPIIPTHLGSVPRGTLIGIDERNGKAITIGNTGFSSFSDLALSGDGRLFGSLGFRGEGGLIQIDPNTGSSFFVGLSGFAALPGLDFAPPGTVWGGLLIGVGGDLSGVNYTLLVIDTFTGFGTPIGPINVPFVDCIVFTDDGRLFGTGFVDGQTVFIEIDPVTGAGRIITPMPFTVVGLEVASDGSLIGSVGGIDPQSGSIVRIDPATGATTLIGPTGFSPVSGLTRLP